MFENFPQSELTIVSPEGTIRSVEKGIVDSKLATIPNKNAVIHVGDEIRRKLPNGIEETFEVIDPVYYEGMHGANSRTLSGENSTKRLISCGYWRVFDI